VHLRQADPSDANAIAQLVGTLGYPTDTAQMTDRLSPILSHPDYRTVVATLDDRVVGLIGFQLAFRYEESGTYVRILILAADPSASQKGIGSALIEEAERFAKEKGANMLVANSGLLRDAAHSFYTSRGFERLSYGFYKLVAT
jgi:GNAT superfamily N-acetyltransferase